MIGEIDWDEFFEVLRGNGPCNAERLERRRTVTKTALGARGRGRVRPQAVLKKKAVA